MNELKMTEESPVKVIDDELTKYHFKKANFYCLRCGASDIVIKDNVKFFANVLITVLEVKVHLLIMHV